MKYIEIADGVSVKICDICAIERETDMTSLVHIEQKIFKSTFPYNVLLDLIEMNKEEDRDKKEELNILKQIGTFAG